MSGPTWLPPRTLDSPERSVPQMSHSAGPPIYQTVNKKGVSDFRPKYAPYDQNGGGGMTNRYMATGSTGPAQGRPSMGYNSHPQSQYHPAPPYPSEHQTPQYSHQPDFYSTSTPKPYLQPVPASYTTASTPTGPRFSVQVKTAQPVTYSQTGRQAEQAYTPPPPRQHVSRPPAQNQTAPQGWYPPHHTSQVQELHSEGGYKGNNLGSGGRVNQVPLTKRGIEKTQTAQTSAQTPSYQSSKQGAATTRPEEELDRLTKKLVYDMNHPPAEDYFGHCARCGDNVVGDGSGCIAMEQVFHVECFTCITCHARLRGQPFYALDKKSYCESCYISTLERCSKCSKPILDRILRAMGKAYHPRCFTCVVCNCCLDGVPFTVDATSQIHCIDDFHRYAPIPASHRTPPPISSCGFDSSKRVFLTGSTPPAALYVVSPSCPNRARRRRSGL
ncbi:hypothetical protein GOODEAATRI_008280 [Goodea atripinnis]|uniref:LIM zinc-binding domain-containing protein n=1 Tax=Goodea atripinnis TaxID=208336 RepID=A0ABV0NSU3_9TELE